jgi:hypothetical protein
VGNVGLALERIFKVVTDTRHTAVPFDLTFGFFKGNWAVTINDCLGGINEGQAL